jgi:hypothetical protein
MSEHCNKIDPKLTIDFGFFDINNSGTIYLDMLIRLVESQWDSSKIPDYREVFKLGRSIGCVGTIRTVKALQKDPNVVFIQANRPSEMSNQV